MRLSSSKFSVHPENNSRRRHARCLTQDSIVSKTQGQWTSRRHDLRKGHLSRTGRFRIKQAGIRSGRSRVAVNWSRAAGQLGRWTGHHCCRTGSTILGVCTAVLQAGRRDADRATELDQECGQAAQTSLGASICWRIHSDQDQGSSASDDRRRIGPNLNQ